jgi:hypothetical protein
MAATLMPMAAQIITTNKVIFFNDSHQVYYRCN